MPESESKRLRFFVFRTSASSYVPRLAPFVILSGALHILIFVLFYVKIQANSYKKFEAASGMSRRMSVNLVSESGVLRVRPERKKEAASRKDAGSAPGRFSSDVLQRETRAVFQGIVYPREARRRGWEGLVVIEAEIRPDGSVVQARVLASSGHAILDRAALRGLVRHVFPKGEKQETIVLRFRFRLR